MVHATGLCMRVQRARSRASLRCQIADTASAHAASLRGKTDSVEFGIQRDNTYSIETMPYAVKLLVW